MNLNSTKESRDKLAEAIKHHSMREIVTHICKGFETVSNQAGIIPLEGKILE